MKNCKIVLIASQQTHKITGRITSMFDHSCEILEKDALTTVRHMIRSTPVKSVILVMEEGLNGHEPEIRQFVEDFPCLPLIAIIPNDLELARKCGEIGIRHTVDISDLSMLQEQLNKTEPTKSFPDCVDFPDIKDSSVLLQKALLLIETEYGSFQQVKQVADRLGVDECTLIREFKKHHLDSPWKILTSIKIYHAEILMNNKGMSIKEIAHLSGFANERQFQRAFKKKYKVAPVDFRNKSLSNNK